MGLPLVLLIWAAFKKQASMVRLLSIYWKVASLLAISMMLLADQRPIGLMTLFISPLLMMFSIWFWVDLNQELADLPPWRALPLTVRIWRWSLSGFSLLTSTLALLSLRCLKLISSNNCRAWIEAPKLLHESSENLFNFLFGANWSEPIAAFVGYVALIAYTVGLLQWLLIRLPKNGRIAGEF